MSANGPDINFEKKTLECSACGASEPVDLPQPLDVFVEVIRRFADTHIRCVKPAAG